MAKLVRDGDRGRARSTRPAEPPAKPRRFTLSDLLVGAEHLPKLYEGVKSALDGPSVGAELG
ncbi:hypothetical protein ASF53_08480 [Methylobacterium sp. Leaf123]|uniref:hypothetical protein n=1 Tax=Methylobacterium sp. Leaf123 TaxID=1736264 RepID=UPI0006F638F7|nr:hypothetical protein [Methylobacterium sp. Leaf123]KQQ14653.1 hypothetical protein ASF53_08480 [Methylobacterium sp. Leaf123]